MKTALVTGSSGFIGEQFVRRLQSDGYRVTGIDLFAPHPPVVPDVMLRGDVRKALPAETFDLVVHAAAIVGGRATIDGEPLLVASDLAIDSDVFQWAVQTRPGRLLYFSSSAAYPVKYQTKPSRIRLAETDLDLSNVAEPDQSYGWVKVTGEKLAGLARARGLAVTVVRPFSGYGETQALDYPMPAIMARVARGDDPVTVWGDGTQVRDFVHVDDIVDACFAVMADGTADPVNIGTGKGTSFLSLVARALHLDDRHAKIAVRPDRPVGVRYRVCDPTRLHTFHVPQIGLDEGIARMLEAMR